MTQATEFEELMAGVAAGQEGAIWELAETYTPYIIRAVRASLPPTVRRRLDSQDFAQILWASLLIKRTDLTRLETPEQLIAFLAKAARNKVIDATRRYLKTQKYDMTREQSLADVMTRQQGSPKEIPSDSLCTQDPTPSEYASLRERWNKILADASARDRQILQLRLEGKTFHAISEKLQINQATARRAIYRLIEQLSE